MAQSLGKFYILHRPRGAGSAWVPIVPRVRVSSKAGKLLRLILESTVPFLPAVEVSLLEKNGSQWVTADPEAFLVRSTNFENNTAQIEVKLKAMYKKLKFAVSFQSPTIPNKIRLLTSTFFAHNTGQPKRWDSKTAEDQATNGHSSDASSPTGYGNSPTDFEMTTDPVHSQNTNGSFLPPQIEGNLSVHGMICAQAYAQMSDKRFKIQIRDLLDALELLNKLQGKKFQWSAETVNGRGGGSATRGHQVLGFIAQEVQRVIPGAVSTSENGYLAIDCSQLIPVLIEAFKLQQQEFNKMKAEFYTGASAISQLIAEINSIIQTSPPPKKPQVKVNAPKTVILQSVSKSDDGRLEMKFKTRNRRALIAVFIILAILVCGGAIAVGLVFGLTSSNSLFEPPGAPGAPPPVEWTPVQIQNGNFSEFNGTGAAYPWVGNYQLLILNETTSFSNATAPDVFSPPFDPENTLLMLGPANFTQAKRAVAPGVNSYGAYQYFPTNFTKPGQVAFIRLRVWANTRYATIVDGSEVTAIVIAYTQGDETISDGYAWDFGLPWTLGRMIVEIPCDATLKGFAVALASVNGGAVLMDNVLFDVITLY